LGFGVSGFITILGSVLTVRDATRASELRREIDVLSTKLTAARDPKRVFFIASAPTEEWQVSLEHNILVQLRSHGFRPTVFAPLVNYSPQEQDSHFREILDRSDDYVGGFAIPIEPDRRSAEFRRFADQFGKPLVFLDNAPFERDDDYPARTRFVGVNSATGGRLAATAVTTGHGLTVRRALVIASNTQTARQRQFRDALQGTCPDCEIVINESGRFCREPARRIAVAHFNDAIASKRPFDVVFCTSDSMALGCLDAIAQVTDWQQCQKPRLIGYDGIPATMQLTEVAGWALERVVVQDTHSIAVAAVEQLLRLLKGEDIRGAEWVEPFLHPGLHGVQAPAGGRLTS